MKAHLPHERKEIYRMNTLNLGIDYTIKVTDLDVTRTYSAILRNAATREKHSVVGFFIGTDCYFYYPATLTATFSVGVYQLNVHDSNNQDMLFNDTFCKARANGLEA
jgi:hypothetical protein